MPVVHSLAPVWLLMTRHLHRCLVRFVRLHAWRCDLRHVELRVIRRPRSRATGRAWGDWRIDVYAGRDVAEAEMALLHELAHLEALHRLQRRKEWRYHGRRHPWRKLYLAAARELTGRVIFDRPTFQELDVAVARAIRATHRKRA